MTKAAAGKDKAAAGSTDLAPGALNCKGTPSFLNTDRKAVSCPVNQIRLTSSKLCLRGAQALPMRLDVKRTTSVELLEIEQAFMKGVLMWSRLYSSLWRQTP